MPAFRLFGQPAIRPACAWLCLCAAATPAAAQTGADQRERMTVSAVRFEGNASIRAGRLRQVVDVRTGAPVDTLAIRDGQQAIAELYRAEGYSDVTVSFDGDLLARTGELVYVINEGRRIRIKEIRFEGNAAFDDGTLRRRIDTRTALWFFRSGAFDESRADADVAKCVTDPVGTGPFRPAPPTTFHRRPVHARSTVSVLHSTLMP